MRTLPQQDLPLWTILQVGVGVYGIFFVSLSAMISISYLLVLSSPIIPRTLIQMVPELGQDAKKRLQLFAAQWNNGVNQIASRLAGNTSSAAGGGMTNTSGNSSGGMPQNRAAANETRGLLDGNDDDDDGEEMEMSFTPTNTPSTKTKHQ